MTKKRFVELFQGDMLVSVKDTKTNNRVNIVQIIEIGNQLNEDNNALIKIIENQSYIIQQLHTKLIEYELKEPIKLTSEDIELMGKAISYYTHGRYAE